VKVRIKATPKEHEIDGVSLEGFSPGTVREVSPQVGSWLIVEQYADAEMRRTPSAEEFEGPPKPLSFPPSTAERRSRKA
jgi:hypothetical protein